MKLNETDLQKKKQWISKNYKLPNYNREIVAKHTHDNPFWIHFGAGNIFRAFQANLVQNLLNMGILHKGLVVAEGYDYEIIEKINYPHDNYSILVTLKSNGDMEKTVVASIMESLTLDSDNETEFNRLIEIFQNSSLQMASFTITEKGYNIKDGNGNMLPHVTLDLKNGPRKPESYIGKVTALLYARYLCEEKPIAMVSMDNCSRNGDKLYDAVLAYAKAWEENKLVKKGFCDYITNPEKVSFPWTMIDKITPRPNSSVEKILNEDGIKDMKPVITSKNSYVAPFVNAEECEYLVIEDSFPNGRPTLEKGGIIFTDKATVNKVETMKVCTCLNPLHTALAVFGCLFGYELISKEMQDDTLRKLVKTIGYIEGLPVVVNPGIIDPKEFLDTVINERIPNPFMPDTPQRIATDTSQKLAIRFGETIKAYHNSTALDTKALIAIPLVIAGWLRYLMAVDDSGNSFSLSPDPLLDTLCPYLSSIRLGDNINAGEILQPILSNSNIFGINLYEAGLASPISIYFSEMIAGPGAVRATLKKYLSY